MDDFPLKIYGFDTTNTGGNCQIKYSGLTFTNVETQSETVVTVLIASPDYIYSCASTFSLYRCPGLTLRTVSGLICAKTTPIINEHE